jgi:hypothetical protein
MGGMEATELIRFYEMHKSLSSTPIIAFAAHASAYPTLNMCNFFVDQTVSLVIGNRERCLQAGSSAVSLRSRTTMKTTATSLAAHPCQNVCFFFRRYLTSFTFVGQALHVV